MEALQEVVHKQGARIACRLTYKQRSMLSLFLWISLSRCSVHVEYFLMCSQRCVYSGGNDSTQNSPQTWTTHILVLVLYPVLLHSTLSLFLITLFYPPLFCSPILHATLICSTPPYPPILWITWFFRFRSCPDLVHFTNICSATATAIGGWHISVYTGSGPYPWKCTKVERRLKIN